MKKFKLLLTLGLFMGVVTLVTSCGGGADAEAEKHRLDSLRQDSIMKADKEKAYNDSVQAVLDSMQRAADSLKAAADAANAASHHSGGHSAPKPPTVVKIDNPKVNTAPASTTPASGGPQGVKGGSTGGTPQGVKGGSTTPAATTPKGVKGGK